ncbi:MAG TPA: TonB-dependent receptor [Trinickia sp.]|jgi:iron complex outermembrane receptor protein|nr:TonB-dependent receptor [Trinickia sp.]
MNQTVLNSAIRKIVWAEVALTAALGTTVAFAQTQPATPGAAAAVPGAAAVAPGGAAAPAAASGAAAAAAKPAAASGAAAASNVHKMQGFQVTGSLIRSSDKVGFNQVQTVTQKDIQNSGAVTVADYLRTLTANSANSWSESTTNNLSAGGSGIALRGLSEKYTLVLVDGQRVAPYGFFSNGVDTFFDLNTLPINMIDRIEVVKTGAVSQYGSDAIAGVVNIITKHDYQGLQLDGSLGTSINGNGGNGTGKLGILGGFGNLTSDGYNVTASLSAYKNNGSTLADRDYGASENFTNQPGGTSWLAPSYWTNPTTGLPQAINGGCPFGGSVKPANTNFATAGSAGTVCGLNTANSVSAIPMESRLSAKVHADFKIDDSTTAFVDLWGSSNQTTQNDGTPTVGVGQYSPPLLYNPTTKTLTTFNTVVPAGIYNPFGQPASLVYALPNAISETTDSNFFRASTGVKGTFSLPYGDWDWAASYGHSQDIVDNTYGNELTVAGLQSLYSGAFNYSNPSAAAVNGLFAPTNSEGISKLDVVDATLSTPNLFHLPTGDVGVGFGAQFVHQSEYLNQGANTNDGEIVSPALQSVFGQRNIAAVYYQFDIPLLRDLTFSQSGRYDHYSDVGGAFSPRFALRYQPVKAFTTYASYNRGFRAPTFVEDANSSDIVLQPNSQTGQFQTTVVQGNPNLQPERTKNYNIGFQLAATRTTDIGFDWYKIHIDNVIGTSTPQAVLGSDGQFLYQTENYANLGTLDTSGFETTFRQSLPTKIGTFTLSGDWAYVQSFVLSEGGVSFNGAGNNMLFSQPFGGSFPRWKGNTTLDWAYHKWDTALTWLYTGPYSQAFSVPGAENSVASYSVFNLMVTYKGFKHWTIYGGVNNVFNRVPPFDPVWQAPLDYTGYDSSLYSFYGRYAQIGASYKF